MPRPNRHYQQRLKKQLRKLGIPKPGADTGANAVGRNPTPAGGKVSSGPSSPGGGSGESPLARHFPEHSPDRISRADLNMVRHLINLGCFTEKESQTLFRAMANVIAKSKDDRAKVNAFKALNAAYQSHVRAAAANRPAVGTQVNVQQNVNLHQEAEEKRERVRRVCEQLGVTLED